VALTWVLTIPGAPLLYYGDEYGEYGGSDPDNRHMWRPAGERSTAESDLFERVERVTAARRQSMALRRGDYHTLSVDEGFLAFARTSGDDVAIVALNHSPDPVERTLSWPAELPAPPASWTDALAPGSDPVPTSGDQITVSLPPRSAAILVP
jgi:glycosidase